MTADAGLAAHEGLQRFGDSNRAVGLLVHFQNRNQNPWTGDHRVVQ